MKYEVGDIVYVENQGSLKNTRLKILEIFINDFKFYTIELDSCGVEWSIKNSWYWQINEIIGLACNVCRKTACPTQRPLRTEDDFK